MVIVRCKAQYLTKNANGLKGISPAARDAYRYESIEAARSDLSGYRIIPWGKDGEKDLSSVEFISIAADTGSTTRKLTGRLNWTNCEDADEMIFGVH